MLWKMERRWKANVLDKLHLPGLRGAVQQVIEKAERNKVFREGSYGGLRCVAIDGWEPFASPRAQGKKSSSTTIAM
jgi:hypothetical protein